MHQISIFFLVVLGGVTIAIFIFMVENLSRKYCKKRKSEKEELLRTNPQGLKYDRSQWTPSSSRSGMY